MKITLFMKTVWTNEIGNAHTERDRIFIKIEQRRYTASNLSTKCCLVIANKKSLFPSPATLHDCIITKGRLQEFSRFM